MNLRIYVPILMGILFVSCSKYLDLKPDAKMRVPTSLEDAEALLNDRASMNSAYSPISEAASDNYYLEKANFDAFTNLSEKNIYIWDAKVDVNYTNWQSSYKVVAIANQVLDILSRLNRSDNPTKYDLIKGQALFFKAFAYQQIADAFTLPYDKSTAASQLGIVLRNSPNVDEISYRSDLETSYIEIKKLLLEGIDLLPAQATAKTLPSKAAAYALLARVALIMQDWPLAQSAAQQCMAINNELIDYNQLNSASLTPFELFNKEVLFHAVTAANVTLTPSTCFVDTALYSSYDENDLRKVIYFSKESSGKAVFKGKFDGAQNSFSFCGLTMDEVYLIQAEASARNDQLDLGLQAFNTLLRKRWIKDSYVARKNNGPAKTMHTILEERRKSLILRNTRWMDIKRLGTEKEYAVELKRKLGDQTYILPNGDLRFAFLIPIRVVNLTNTIQQNPR
ncbi:RagB/SusD family nutrient uptake outer membrane protein [Sphingobacterium sp.]|uniref:RagB/SusD family nutrient uptake outer membrane protein n=1 Tax=Sphingobacterium sp. TaxID=341027 RepID=UPI0025DE660C|nr:RagB/SusD family nutrient uptake outer membrane protein [Sphingobacterium sp.]